MGRITLTLTDQQQAIAEEMASAANVSVKDCLSRLLTSRLASYATQQAEQKWSEATPEQKQAALKALGKGTKKKAAKKKKKG